MDFRTTTVAQLAQDVSTKRISARELVGAALARIEEVDNKVNAFVSVDAERALADAAAIDQRLAAGEDVGPLAGVPIGVKDLEDAAGFCTTQGSVVYAESPMATEDSPLVERLKAAGCVVVGKTNTPELGHKADTSNPLFGATSNPWDLGRSAGGSSGGSAAAVAAGLVPLCTGSDGGGSIRIPSSVCGLTGMKPSNGVVPNGDGDAPTWGPFSTRGPVAGPFPERACANDVVAGHSDRDLMSFDLAGSFAESAAQGSLEGVRIIWSPTLGVATPDADMVDACERALAVLEEHGARVVETADAVFSEAPVRSWFTRAAAGSWRTASLDPMPWDGRFLPAAQFTAQYGESVTAVQLVEAE